MTFETINCQSRQHKSTNNVIKKKKEKEKEKEKIEKHKRIRRRRITGPDN